MTRHLDVGRESIWSELLALHVLGPAYADQLIAEGRSLEDIVAFRRSLNCCVQWHRLGMPTFRLTHSLAAALLLTDPSGLDPHEIRFPFDAFVLALPKPQGPIQYLASRNDGSEDQLIDAEYVAVHAYSNTVKPYTDDFAAYVRDHYRTPDDVLDRFRAYPTHDNVSLYMQSEVPWAACMWRHSYAPWNDDAAMKNWLYDFTDHPQKDDQAASRAMVRLVTNFAVYLSGLTQRGTWTPPHRRKSGKWSDKMTWTLGQEIKLARELRDAARFGAGTTTKARLSARFVVRGHWRNQAHGPKQALRRRQWVAPYWKGPTDANQLERIYQLGSGD